MVTHVYANDLEIACKSTDGVATTAFPDPCWSPPPPKGGPILIPYGNVAYAPDITNGTSTVFIAGQTVAIEDKAYFATSTGNEPATYAFSKGIRTNVIKGKAYFRSWSLDVVFEGRGVDRHTDLVSHNHGSMPSNTPLFPYISRSVFGNNPCKGEEKRIEKACRPDKDRSKTGAEIKSKSSPAARLLKKISGKPDSGKSGKPWHWTDDHCDGMHMPPLDSREIAKKYAEDLSEVFEALPRDLDALAVLEDYLKDTARNAAGKAAAKVAAKAAAKQLAGSSLPLAGNIAMGAWTAVDAAMAINDVAEVKAAVTEVLEQLDVLREKATELQDFAGKFEDFRKLSPEEQLKQAQKIAAAGQDMLATLNACTRARKCTLPPFKNKGGSKVEPAGNGGGGCCRGQTGHHLIYGVMMDDCDNYKHKQHDDAPTVCTEGINQSLGSHGRVYDAMDKEIRDLVKRKKIKNGTMSMDDAINAAANSHKAAFPLSKCSKDCIVAQLKAFYKNLGCDKVKTVDKFGHPVSQQTTGGR
jgi:hypothetical protein